MTTDPNDLRFDVALSYTRDASWVAKDIYHLLTQYGISVFCYDYLADYARGFLRSELRNIYSDSLVNVVIWSATYREHGSDSLVAMERRRISNRHVEKGDARSLAILALDDTPLDRDLEEVLTHKLTDIGVFQFGRMLVGRLKKLRREWQLDQYAVHHPLGTENTRGQLHPCTFQIDESFQTDPLNRWERLGDVLVRCEVPGSAPYVYLIPSGACTPMLRHSLMLKTDPELLSKKRTFTTLFASKHVNLELHGYWFPMRVGPEMVVEVPTVYAREYDLFLNTSFHEHE